MEPVSVSDSPQPESPLDSPAPADTPRQRARKEPVRIKTREAVADRHDTPQTTVRQRPQRPASPASPAQSVSEKSSHCGWNRQQSKPGKVCGRTFPYTGNTGSPDMEAPGVWDESVHVLSSRKSGRSSAAGASPLSPANAKGASDFTTAAIATTSFAGKGNQGGLHSSASSGCQNEGSLPPSASCLPGRIVSPGADPGRAGVHPGAGPQGGCAAANGVAALRCEGHSGGSC